MTASIFRVATLALALVSSWAAESAPVATVSAEGLRIVHHGYQDHDELRPFHWFAGTTLALRVTMPAGGLVSLDRSESALAIFRDDVGTDLLKHDQKTHFHSDYFDTSASYAKDGTACLFEVLGESVPAHGATTLHVQGTLALDCSTQKKTVKQENVALVKGAAVTLGSLSLTVSKVDSDDDGVSIDLKGHGVPTILAAIRFLDADGKEIESHQSGSSSSNSGDAKNGIFTNFYHVQGKPTQVTVSAESVDGPPPGRGALRGDRQPWAMMKTARELCGGELVSTSTMRETGTMGLLTLSINVTLDGCVDHQEGIADDETHACFTRLMDEGGAMLWGRVTYAHQIEVYANQGR